ncbi:MAG TPA: hypothetical protein VGX50_05315 [Longimicrobium sp.]|jgi:hypothetical protein|nr:hypothetical protein [Longimicrobium sp.]
MMPSSSIDAAREALYRLQEVQDELRQSSYFDLSTEARTTIERYEAVGPFVPQITAWTFIPHPLVLRKLFQGEEPLTRYVVTIDALRSSVYQRVKEYLEAQEANVTSYFSGGWADFLCDVQLQRTRFDVFLKELEGVLKEAGLEQFAQIDEVISVFEMVNPVILSGRRLDSLPRPANALLEEISQEKATFEVVLANYRSSEAVGLLGGEEQVRQYLRRLQSGGAIVAFRPVCDFASWVQHDYVPIILGIGHTPAALEKFLEVCEERPSEPSPIVDLFECGTSGDYRMRRRALTTSALIAIVFPSRSIAGRSGCTPACRWT